MSDIQYWVVQNPEGLNWNGKRFDSAGTGYRTQRGVQAAAERVSERTGSEVFIVGCDSLGNKVSEQWA